MQLTIKCGTEIVLIVFDKYGEVTEYASGDIDELLRSWSSKDFSRTQLATYSGFQCAALFQPFCFRNSIMYQCSAEYEHDPRKRKASYMKRKTGLFKKAAELANSCQTDLILLVFDEDGRSPETTGIHSGGDIDLIVQRWLKATENEPAKLRYGPENVRSNLFFFFISIGFLTIFLEKVSIQSFARTSLQTKIRKKKRQTTKRQKTSRKVEWELTKRVKARTLKSTQHSKRGFADYWPEWVVYVSVRPIFLRPVPCRDHRCVLHGAGAWTGRRFDGRMHSA